MPWQGEVLKQKQKQSCGYCCIGMVARLIDSKHPQYGEQGIVAAGKGLDPNAYDRAAMDRVGAKATPIIAAAREEFGVVPHWGTGTYGQHLAQVLRESFQIDALYQGASPSKSAMRRATEKKPVIVLVSWNGGGGHWVVVKKRRTRGPGRSSDYTILDPQGHVVVNRGSTDYSPPYGGHGTFANYFVEIRGKLPTRRVKLPGM